MGEVCKGNQQGCLIFADGADAVARQQLCRRQRTFVAAFFEYGAWLSAWDSVEHYGSRQALGRECDQKQSGERLRNESCRANDAEKCSTFQVTVRLPLF